MRVAFMMLLLGCVAACTKHNPASCCTSQDQCDRLGLDQIYACEGGLVCSENGACEVPECQTSADCTASPERPICVDQFCAATCTADQDCLGLGDRTHCAPDGACVACTMNDQCTASTPVCDATDRTCRGCVADPECATGVCLEDQGTCAEMVPSSWAKHFTGISASSLGVALDADGNVYVTGAFAGTIDLGGGPLSATGMSDLFVAKFTAGGAHVWSRHYGGSSAAVGGSEISVLSNGDLVVGGTFTVSVPFGGTTLTSAGGQDVFVARLSATGDPQWAVAGGTPGTDSLFDLDVDANGNVAVCGDFTGSGSFFGTNLTGSSDSFVGRLASNGVASWVKSIASPGFDGRCGVASLSNGDVAVAANFTGTVNVGGATFTATGGTFAYDILLARFAVTTGAHVWSAQKGGTGTDIALDVAASGTSVLLTGYFDSSLDLGGGMLTSAGGSDVFVAKFRGNDGGHEWSKAMGGQSVDLGTHIVVRSDGQPSFLGRFTGSADFAGTILTSHGSTDVFAIDADATTGAIGSTVSLGANGQDTELDVANSSTSLVIAGSFMGTINLLGTDYTTTAGASDVYLVRFKR